MRLLRFSWLLVPLVVLFLDVVSKRWILHHLLVGATRPVWPGVFNLTLGYNPGAIFGSLASAPPLVKNTLFLVAGLAALGYFGWEFLKDGTPAIQRWALGFILGGAMGNGLDRLQHGAVVDFLDFILFGWHYWTFNLADSFIVCGAILLGISFFIEQAKKRQPAA